MITYLKLLLYHYGSDIVLIRFIALSAHVPYNTFEKIVSNIAEMRRGEDIPEDLRVT